MSAELTRDQWLSLFRREGYPLSSKYDPQWIVDNAMGSHCLWLTESLARVLPLKPGQRVLDLGCGKTLSSIFLAREFGVQVWAVDIGVPPTENLQRIRDAGVEERVFPLHGDARALPFADGFFDAVVSINAYWIFGTDDFYLPRHFGRLLKPGGHAGLIMPGLLREYSAEIPEHVKPYWLSDVIAYHSPDWWRRHLSRAGLLNVLTCDNLDGTDGTGIWRDWVAIRKVNDSLIEQDCGQNISFVRLVAQRPEDGPPPR